MTSPDRAVILTKVGKKFADGPNTHEALAGIDLELARGEFVTLLGPSGCGKSTLLRLIAGLEPPSSGEVHVLNRDLAFVFQDAHLLPWRTVIRNAEIPLELRGEEHQARSRAAARALGEVGLGDSLERYPAQLSGGMRMRVSLARALVTNPGLLLLDEPFAALDELTRNRLIELLRSLWLERRMTVVFVTHSVAEAVYLSSRSIVLSARPGRIVRDHRIELPERRTPALRGDVAFARESQLLLAALEEGEA